MRLFRSHVLPGALAGVAVDMALCFVAVLLAASTLTSRYMTIPTAVPELPLVLFGASLFALVMAMLYALFGLYRPKPISAIAATRAHGRGAVHRCVRDEPHIAGGRRSRLHRAVDAGGDGLPRRSVWSCRACGSASCGASRPLPRVLVVGTGAEALAIAADLQGHGRAARNVIGFFETSSEPQASEADKGGSRVFPNHSSLTDLVSRYDIQEIIVAVREHRGGGVPMDQLLECRIRGVSVLDLAGFCERAKGEVPIDSLKGSWLIYGNGFVQGSLRRFIKRSFDIVSATVLLLLTTPIMILAMIAVRLESPGPVIYRQPRVGLGGRIFMCTKLRSMCVDAERDGLERWASRNDPRITRVGAFIRKTRIDELPQLFSVLSWRDEPGRAAPRTPQLRRSAQGNHSVLRVAPFGEAWNHRMGAGQVSLRRIARRRPQEAPVRPVLRQEQLALPGYSGPGRDGERGAVSRGAVRAIALP